MVQKDSITDKTAISKMRIVSFLFVFFFSMSALAEDINALMLHLVSNRQVVFMLDEKPVITFRGDELVLSTHLSEVSYQSVHVNKFTYIFVDSNEIERMEEPRCLITLQGETLSAIGLEPNSKIGVYTVDGNLISTAIADKKGAATVILPNQSAKVFIVKTSAANFKISQR